MKINKSLIMEHKDFDSDIDLSKTEIYSWFSIEHGDDNKYCWVLKRIGDPILEYSDNFKTERGVKSNLIKRLSDIIKK